MKAKGNIVEYTNLVVFEILTQNHRIDYVGKDL